jgi:hypothetical protein
MGFLRLILAIIVSLIFAWISGEWIGGLLMFLVLMVINAVYNLIDKELI